MGLDLIYIYLCTYFCFQRLQNNGSVFIHVYFVKNGHSPNPKDKSYRKDKTAFKSKSKHIFLYPWLFLVPVDVRDESEDGLG